MTPDLAEQLGKRNNMPLPESVKTASTADGFAFHDLTSFLAVHYPAMTVLQTPEDFHDLAYDCLARAYAQNVLHCELFFDPQAHTSRGIPFPAIIAGYRSTILQAERDLGINASLIMCFLRDMSADSAMENTYACATVQAVHRWGRA